MLCSRLLLAAGCLAALCLTLPLAAADAPAKADKAAAKYWVYFGTYTGKESKGIYRGEFDPATGKLTKPVLAGEAVNPSFVAIHPNGRFLYAVGEVNTTAGKKEGGVSAFAIDPKTGDLTLLNSQTSGGAGPCHINVDKAGKNALVANYGSGSACVLPIGGDGKLAAASGVVQHEGKGANPARQSAPHAHSINLDAANTFAFVADLGLDKVMIYKFDAQKGTLTANDPPAGTVAPGSGPRHFAFHPSGKYAYVINEMTCTMTAFSYDAAKGTLKEIQTLTTLPHEVKQGYSTAEVVCHPSGKFVYGSNRGHNSIAVFTVDEATGKLTSAGHEATGIKTPRNFNLDPTGKWLLVANQSGDSVSIFSVDQKTGALKPAGDPVPVPAPVCVRFLAVP